MHKLDSRGRAAWCSLPLLFLLWEAAGLLSPGSVPSPHWLMDHKGPLSLNFLLFFSLAFELSCVTGECSCTWGFNFYDYLPWSQLAPWTERRHRGWGLWFICLFLRHWFWVSPASFKEEGTLWVPVPLGSKAQPHQFSFQGNHELWDKGTGHILDQPLRVTGSSQSWLRGWFCMGILLANTLAERLRWGDGALGEDDSHTLSSEGDQECGLRTRKAYSGKRK